eukprot:XP_017949444.1 PREDICTED: nuclear receptor coactivator 7-like [Xenopus tropicalis]
MSCIDLEPGNITEVTTVTQNVENKLSKPEEKVSEESVDSLSPSSPEVPSQKETLMDSESELKLWLIKRMQRPIEDLFPSKEEKSKIPPMFLCIRVGKPMRKSFASQSTAVVQQYIRRRKQPEYWFAVPQERVDHLYNFFVQWSPEVYGKDAKEQGFVVVEKDELNMIDNFFSEPSTKSWEIITVEEAKRRKSTCSCYDDDEDEEETLEDFLPDLKQKSVLLDDMQVEKLAHNLPARVQGYLWHLVYSTQEHGTSLKTLYRNLATVDSPVLLVVKDMDNQVFGAYATHPFRLSDHYYGTGETFLYTFCPDFKAQTTIDTFIWSGKKPRIKRKYMQQHTKEGGFGVPSIENYYKAAILEQLAMWNLPPDHKHWLQIEQEKIQPFTLQQLMWSEKPLQLTKGKTIYHTTTTALKIWTQQKAKKHIHIFPAKLSPLNTLETMIPNLSISNWNHLGISNVE